MNITKFPLKPVLVVDDEEQFLYSMSITFKACGITNIQTCHSGSAAREHIVSKNNSVILLDINLPDCSGLELLDFVLEKSPDTPVIMITALNQAHTAVDCIKKGAIDYLVKPLDTDRLVACVKNALAQKDLTCENEALKGYLLGNRLQHPDVFKKIVTGNKKMNALFQYIEAIAGTPFPVLITGETGVGKELIAQAIHDLSGRKGLFVPVNVGGIDDTTFSDTLFGHVKGAYTGADSVRQGIIERAANGTLFLDEIGDLTKVSQIKLLRVLQNRDYLPLGSDIAKLATVRLVVATNKDISELADPAVFRSDLFHRLRTHHIAIPPLRERMDDIVPLVNCFLQEAADVLGKRKPEVPSGLFPLLSSYDFPGNVRELRSMIFDAVTIEQSNMISLDIFRSRIPVSYGVKQNEPVAQIQSTQAPGDLGDKLPTIKSATQALIAEALVRSNGNQNAAAKLLGITPQALSRRLKYINSKKNVSD
jgi:DNA-binding NtrC family response regulator